MYMCRESDFRYEFQIRSYCCDNIDIIPSVICLRLRNNQIDHKIGCFRNIDNRVADFRSIIMAKYIKYAQTHMCIPFTWVSIFTCVYTSIQIWTEGERAKTWVCSGSKKKRKVCWILFLGARIDSVRVEWHSISFSFRKLNFFECFTIKKFRGCIRLWTTKLPAFTLLLKCFDFN